MAEFVEFSKISVHNHLGGQKADRTIDKAYNESIEFSFKEAVESIQDAKNNNFDLIAFTNSNIFLLEEYICLKIIASKLGITLIPGIEMNIKANKKEKYLHTVVLFNPNSNLFNIRDKINTIINKNKGNYFYIEDLIEVVENKNTNAILIPHGIKQSGTERSASRNPEQFVELIAFNDAFPVLIEDNRTFHKEQLLIEIKDLLNSKDQLWVTKAQSVSSADRLKFSEIQDPTYIWGENNYSNLYYAALIKNGRIKKKNDITNKSCYISKIVIKPKNTNSQIEEKTIYCSHGLNSIIGKSGSGKTLLLNAIKFALKGENLSVKSSSNNAYDGIYKDVSIELYDCDDNIVDIKSKWEVFEGENLYNKILEVYKSDKIKIVKELGLDIIDKNFKDTINHYNNDLNMYIRNSIIATKMSSEISNIMNKFSSNIEFLNNNVTPEDPNLKYLVDMKNISEMRKLENNIYEINNDLKSLDESTTILNNLLLKYSLEAVEERIIEIRNKIFIKIKRELLKTKILSMKLNKITRQQREIYNIINIYNKKMGDKIGKILTRQQENLEIIERVISEMSNLLKIKHSLYIPVLSKEKFNKSLYLENSEFAKLEIKKINLKFDKDEYLNLFDNNIGSSSNKLNKSLFKMDNLDLRNPGSVLKFLDIFISNDYDLPINISYNYNDYINYEIQLLRANNQYEKIENMSAGELAKTYISNMLDKNVNNKGTKVIVLFDQPDTNLEKSFILNDLSDKIDKLRNQYQIFITTHEPLLVVNADSNNIIQSINEKSAIIDKNRIKYKNLSFVKTNLTREKMVDKIAELVDGSTDAISERNRIYGGMLNEN